MFNCNSKLNGFYDSKVRLKEKHEILREYRDTNIQRIKDGIKLLNEDREKKIPSFVDDFGQGSMAMYTINQSQHGEDHDIDHALIFEAEDIANWSPKKLREAIADSICKTGTNFSRDPEARKNAVTVWYADGYHVDFALYKKESNLFGGDKYYHAGGDEWTLRDPDSITAWFDERNKILSPKDESFQVLEVKSNQLRRLTRLFKYWSKSRVEWSLPSGLVLTALFVECYKPDRKRDDIAFLNTLIALKNRLSFNTEVLNPTNSSISLLGNDFHIKQVESLLDKITSGLNNLLLLSNSGITEEKAYRLWGTFFNNDWWPGLSRAVNDKTMLMTDQPFDVKVWVSPKHKNRPPNIPYNPESNQFIPKKMNIRFQLIPKIQGLQNVTWKVQNTGDEATWEKQHAVRDGVVDTNNSLICNELSAFKGNHIMICTAVFNGRNYEKRVEVRIR